MAFRLRRLREISRVLSPFMSSGIPKQHKEMCFATCVNPLPGAWGKSNRSIVERGYLVYRYSTMPEAPKESCPEVDFLDFVKSIVDELKGPHHCWFNRVDETAFNREGVFLVVSGVFLDHSNSFVSGHSIVFETVKLLQKRFPKLNIIGFQSVSSVDFSGIQAALLQTIMKEYLTFPVLLSKRDFFGIKNGATYLVFEDLNNPLLSHMMMDLDLEMIVKVIEERHASHNSNDVTVYNLKSTWAKHPEVIKEPFGGCSLRNLLLFFPGGISVDEDGNRLFLSDTNHHRIIITDGDGEILDCIGSSPGFEDGDFESSKLMRPAASLYNAAEDCLYFVDSENHAIRKADMETRMLETLHPFSDSHVKNSSIWSWILGKLGLRSEADSKPQKFGVESITFPWHLMRSNGHDLLVINRSFETLWILSTTTGTIKEAIKGSLNVVESCGKIISEKVTLLEEMFGNNLLPRVDPIGPLTWFPNAGLISSIASFKNNILFCDSGGRRILKCLRGSKDIKNIQFSNFGVLGLPYWLAHPLESVFVCGNLNGGLRNDHVQYFNVLPGKCEIQVNIDIPDGAELVSQLQEGSVWRQARGSAVEIAGSEAVAIASEKVGIAQQWFDELDNLAFSTHGMESSVEDEESSSDRNSHEEKKLHVDCAVNISPGTSEVVISTVLYLKLNHPSSLSDNDAAEMVLDTPRWAERRLGNDACKRFLLESGRGLEGIIFMKPFRVRIRLECGDHPTTTDVSNSKELICTDSSLLVNVSLE